MVCFVLRKLILQTRMHSHPVGLDVWFLVGHFVYFHTSCERTAKALARLRGCTSSPEPLLVAYVISTIISCAGSIHLLSSLSPHLSVIRKRLLSCLDLLILTFWGFWRQTTRHGGRGNVISKWVCLKIAIVSRRTWIRNQTRGDFHGHFSRCYQLCWPPLIHDVAHLNSYRRPLQHHEGQHFSTFNHIL